MGCCGFDVYFWLGDSGCSWPQSLWGVCVGMILAKWSLVNVEQVFMVVGVEFIFNWSGRGYGFWQTRMMVFGMGCLAWWFLAGVVFSRAVERGQAWDWKIRVEGYK